MNYIEMLARQEKKDKQKSFRYSTIITVILILLALLPFFAFKEKPQIHNPVLITFGGSSKEGAKSSSSADFPNHEATEAGSESEVSEEVPVEEEVPEREEIEVPQEVESPSSTPVLTSKTEPPLVNNTKVKKVEVKQTPVPTKTLPTKTTPNSIPTKPTKTKVKSVKVRVVKVKNSTGSGGGSGSSSSTKAGGAGGGTGKGTDGDGNSQGTGKGKSGDGSSASGTGQDGKGKGDGFGDDIGDGILTRPIISNPDVNDLVKENGEIVINVCVARNGEVIYAKANRTLSTIKDESTLKATEKRAYDYKFAKDSDAPIKECGYMKFIFEIE